MGVPLQASSNTISVTDREKHMMNRTYIILTTDCRQSIMILGRKQGNNCAYISYQGTPEYER